MLDDSSRFEQRGHHSIVASYINEGSVSKESIRIAPNTLRVFVSQVLHSVCAVLAIVFFGIRGSSDEELDLILELIEQRLNRVDDQMNALLFSYTTDESK